MLKIFRRIRQRLLAESRFRKYLLYGTGEIVLVVIGILIALQINNWNQNRKDRINEEYYLNQIVLELEEDIEVLSNELARNLRTIPNVRKLLDVLHQEPIDKLAFNQNVKQYINEAWYPYFFKSNKATFEEMKSSGRLAIIKDKELRNKIVRLYTNVENTEWYFQELNIFTREKVIDLALDKGFGKFMDYQKETFSKYLSPDDLYELSKYKEALIGQVVNHNWNVFESEPIINHQLQEMSTVVEEIKATLTKEPK